MISSYLSSNLKYMYKIIKISYNSLILILTGSSLPNNKFRNVDLPTPLGPTTATRNQDKWL